MAHITQVAIYLLFAFARVSEFKEMIKLWQTYAAPNMFSVKLI